MRIPRLYYKGDIKVPSEIQLSESASMHITQVLRLRLGAKITIFNGKAEKEFHAELSQVKSKSAVIAISASEMVDRESKIKIHLGQALSKGDRMDYAIQKAVECGVFEITPLMTKRSDVKLNAERLEKRRLHWQSIAINACQQSGRCIVPEIHSPKLISDWMQVVAKAQPCFICEPQLSDESAVLKQLHSDQLALLIGPEGGFDESEIAMAKGFAFKGLSLGPRILRTETAPVVAMTKIALLTQ